MSHHNSPKWQAAKAARNDPRWRKAQAAFLAEYDDLDPDQAVFERIKAICLMREIEREYEARAA